MELADLDEQLIDLNPFRVNELRRFPSSNHSAPLTKVLQDSVVRLYSGDPTANGARVFSRYVETITSYVDRTRSDLRLTTDTTQLLTWAFEITRDTSHNGIGDISYLTTGLNYVLREVRSDLEGIGRMNSSFPRLRELITVNHRQVEELIKLVTGSFSMLTCLTKIRNKRQLCHVQGSAFEELETGFMGVKVLIMQDLILFIGLDGPGVLINYDQLLMLTDTVSCRSLSALTCALNDITKRDLLPPLDLLLQVYKWGDDIITECGEAAYAVIGEYESIVTSVFVNFRGGDLLELGRSYMDSVIEQSLEIQSTYGIPMTHTQKLLDILTSITCPNVLSEIFGLRKHWGNPVVDASASGRAVQDKVDEVLPVSGPAVWNLLASFMRMIILEFIKKHGKWPECYCLTPEAEFPLVRAWRRKQPRILEQTIGHQHFHWCLFKFKPNCVINDYRNQLDTISDKSISLYREHLMGVYVRALSAGLPRLVIEENRRMILEFIRKDHLDILDILRIIMSGAYPQSWLANSACMKGTEMKYQKARIFAVLTYEIRQYFAVTEDILKEHLFPYNPHQTMTMAEHQLLERLRGVTNQMETSSDSEYLQVMHIIDFSKWNLRMRYSNTNLIFKAIDDFTGTPGLFERSHVLFEEMINIVQSPFEPPSGELEESCSDTVWKFHTCGWEGQRQKGWTILTSALLSDIERVTGIHSTICGQGDNQTLLARFPIPQGYRSAKDWIARKPEEVRSVIDQFYRTLETECTKVGLKIKTAESCRSLRYFNYGKRLYYDGVELSMTLKRISKIATEPNDSFPTTENKLKTAEGAAYASGLFSHPSILPYLIGRLMTYIILYTGLTINPLIQQTSHFYSGIIRSPDMHLLVRRIIRIPQSLGGPPQQMLSAYLFRGHPDPLCTDLVMLVFRAHSGCEVSRRILCLAISGKWFNDEEPHWTALITAPFSLNVIRPLSAGKPLEEQVKLAISQTCRNTDVQEIFNNNLDEYELTLVNKLCQTTPLNPLVLNDIYSRSLPGRRLSFVSGLKNSTSLSRLVSDSIINPMLERVARLECEQQRRWVRMALDVHLVNPNSMSVIPLHHVLAQQLREMSWKRPIEGVTVPHPLEQFVILDAKYDLCRHHESIYRDEHIVFQCHSQHLNTDGVDRDYPVQLTRSKKGSAYHGNSISEGIIQRYVHCLNSNDVWHDAIRLNTLKRWICEEGDHMSEFLESIIATRTNVPMGMIDSATGFPSRLSYNHRAALLSTVKSCNISTCGNMHTRIYISSNRMGIYSHGESNYHMPFGPAFLLGQSLIVLLMTLDNGRELLSNSCLTYHMHVRNDNIPVVYDGSITLPSVVETPTISTRSRLLFVDYESLIFRDVAGNMTSGIWWNPENASIRYAKLCYANQLLSGLFLKETIAREQMTLLGEMTTMQVYDSISSGDVGLIGVDNYVDTIAFLMLLFGPTNIIRTLSSSSCMVLSFNFLQSISDTFWRSVARPFLVPRVFQKLLHLAGPYNVYDSTSGLSGITMILKVAICRAMSSQLNIWRENLEVSPRFTIGVLCCPSLNILRFFWSKFVEVTILLSGQRRGGPRDTEDFQRALDFVSNIHSVDLDVFPTLKRRIESDFSGLCRLWGLRNVSSFPQIRLYNSLEPWVDKLRQHLVNDTTQVAGSNSGTSMFRLRSSYRQCISLACPPLSPWIESDVCDCPNTAPSNMIHLECLFTQTGKLSKSHLRYAEIIHKENFNVKGVLCLGTSTGSEAAYISSFEENERVYVNCLRETSQMGEHIAGTFIPAAFCTDGNTGKLVNSPAAVLSSNDLLSSNTVDAIVAHTAGELFTGVTCDAELPLDSTFETFMNLIRNVVKICARITTISWMIIKVPLTCTHKLHRLCSVGSRVFSFVQVIQTNFSCPNSQTVMLTFSQRHSDTAAATAASIDLDMISLSCLSGLSPERLSDLYSHSLVRDVRALIDNLALGLSRVDNVLSTSITVACMKVIPGWFHLEIPNVPSRRRLVLQELRTLKEDLQRSLINLCRLSVRTTQDFSMIRSQILALTSTDAVPQVMGKLRMLVLVELLMRFLNDNVMSVNVIHRQLVHWVSRPIFFELMGVQLPVAFSRKRFLSITSRYILEVIGYVFKGQIRIPNNPSFLLLIHRSTGFDDRVGVGDSWSLGLRTSRPTIRGDKTWCWEERSFLLSVLLTHQVKQTQIRVDSTCSHASLVGELIRMRPWLESGICVSAANDANFFWTNDVEVLQRLPNGVTVVTSVHNYRIISSRSSHVFRCPWSGIKPMRCCVYLSRSPEPVDQTLFVDTSCNVNAVFDEGLFGCHCADCATEGFLSKVFKITYSDISEICKSGGSRKRHIFEF
jgi:hypothetical protein